MLPDQELLLEGAGITVDDLRRVSRWHGRMVNPKLARAKAAEVVAHVVARKKRLAKTAKTGKASSLCTLCVFNVNADLRMRDRKTISLSLRSAHTGNCMECCMEMCCAAYSGATWCTQRLQLSVPPSCTDQPKPYLQCLTCEEP